MNNKKLYLAVLHSIGFTHIMLNKIFVDNENYEDFLLNISKTQLKKLGFTEKKITSIIRKNKEIKLDFIKEKLKEREVKIVTINDKEYPCLLKEIPNPPYFFYLRGNIDNSLKISVVGARNISDYGKRSIQSIVPKLSKYFTIVSGGALGCDSEAHKSTIYSKNKTISVIGTGIDIDYPVSNGGLYNQIIKYGGSIISIFPIGEIGNPYNFPIRNEIVAGLSLGTLVIEAKEKSGSLITSNLSLDLGRDLYSVPGDIFKQNSEGCNNLIKRGEAKLITKAEDVLCEYNILTKSTKNEKQFISADKIENDIYNLLLNNNFNSNIIAKELDINISTINQKLSIMEINGIIKLGLGGEYNII